MALAPSKRRVWRDARESLWSRQTDSSLEYSPLDDMVADYDKDGLVKELSTGFRGRWGAVEGEGLQKDCLRSGLFRRFL